ncbi:MAG: response regulator [Pseudobdellovibrionaceae bacterium]
MPIRVLIADDAPFVQEIMEHIVSRAGYVHVGTARDGEEAVKMALQHRPDVILMDIVMPKKSGVDATRIILEQLPLTKIIAVSTQDDEFIITRALEAGCCEFLVKPFDEKSVVRAIKNSVGLKTQEGATG